MPQELSRRKKRLSKMIIRDCEPGIGFLRMTISDTNNELHNHGANRIKEHNM